MTRRQTVGAHYGLTDWLAQRVTAVVMTLEPEEKHKAAAGG